MFYLLKSRTVLGLPIVHVMDSASPSFPEGLTKAPARDAFHRYGQWVAAYMVGSDDTHAWHIRSRRWGPLWVDLFEQLPWEEPIALEAQLWLQLEPILARAGWHVGARS